MELLNNVLVVDDDPALLEQAEAILSPQYGVSLASSGEQALLYLEKGNRPDLILLDILMPGMDGYETLAAIRAVEGCGHIPVVYVTSLTGPDAEVKGLTSGAADFLTKPFVPQVLLTRVALRLRREYALNEERLSALPAALTERERQVLRLLARGRSNEEISRELHYSYGYVKQLVSRLLGKLGVRSRKELSQFFY